MQTVMKPGPAFPRGFAFFGMCPRPPKFLTIRNGFSTFTPFLDKTAYFSGDLSKLSIILDKMREFERRFVQITAYFGQKAKKQTGVCPNSRSFWTEGPFFSAVLSKFMPILDKVH